jgi:cytoskeleton protein RodZ
MDQLGQAFKEARTQSGKSIDDAVRETKIAKKYLVAIENEDFDIFPGETYLIGFLRNYAQFLGLNPDEMVIKYRDYKIQEQPAPIEQLTARPRTVRRNFLIIFVILIVIVATMYIILGGRKKDEIAVKEKGKTKEEEATGPQKEKGSILFEEEELTRDFTKGNIITVPQRNKSYNITIDAIDSDLKFSIGNIPFTLSADERVEIDFDRDGRKDILIRPNVMGEGMVNLTLKRLYTTGLTDSEIALAEKTESQTSEAGPPEVIITKESDLISQEPIAPKTGFQIVSGYSKVDIDTHIKADNVAYFSYIVDEEEKKELLLQPGDELDLKAKDVLWITAANAKAVDIVINNIPVTLGEAGQVVAKVVRWYRDSEDNDLYHLIIDDWVK